MCGRFTLKATAEALNELFPSLFDHVELEPRYNIAPSQNVLAVRLKPDGGTPEPVWLRWGLVPSWADDVKIGYRLINARADTAAVKPAFRSAFKHRHCLILADGFFEWQGTGAKHKQPYYIHLRDGRLFAFAGLWERWRKGEEDIESCTILTTDANSAIAKVHNRMPVVIAPQQFDTWLSSGGDVTALLQPSPAEQWTASAVSTLVNNPKNDVPACVVPV
jgi:putative SOS response-associated peptidase YedK